MPQTALEPATTVVNKRGGLPALAKLIFKWKRQTKSRFIVSFLPPACGNGFEGNKLGDAVEGDGRSDRQSHFG